jgi:Tol biopolymer transport system component
MARYTSLGYLVFQRGETLLAAPFDPGKLAVTGESFAILEGVSGDPTSGSGYFAVSDQGVIVLTPETSIPKNRALVLVDRSGKETPLAVDAASFFHPRISPDGRRVTYAVGTGSAADDDVFVLDLATSRPQRLTFGLGHGMPIWTRDGRKITYTKGRLPNMGVATRAADGSGEETILLGTAEQRLPDSWHPDGRRLLLTNAEGSVDITVVDEANRESPLFANPKAGESMADLSPDGRYVAYTSTETGKEEVIVETFPPGAGKWQVSTSGGSMPAWSRDGKFLYFVSDQSLFATPVELGPEFRPGQPRLLFSGPYDVRTAIQRNYDVGPDGRFIMIKRQASSSPGEFLVLEGWEQSDPARRNPRPGFR